MIPLLSIIIFRYSYYTNPLFVLQLLFSYYCCECEVMKPEVILMLFLYEHRNQHRCAS